MLWQAQQVMVEYNNNNNISLFGLNTTDFFFKVHIYLRAKLKTHNAASNFL